MNQDYYSYIQNQISKALAEEKELKNKLFVDDRLIPIDNDPYHLMAWDVLILEQNDIYEGNWEEWLFGAGQTLLRVLEDKYCPGTKWGYAANHENDDLECRTFVGFQLRLKRQKELSNGKG